MVWFKKKTHPHMYLQRDVFKNKTVNAQPPIKKSRTWNEFIIFWKEVVNGFKNTIEIKGQLNVRKT